ncbi:MAG: hypothetical protein BRD57_02390 [Proteobacteria bacterium SW_6_67_9]|nr:MAG: hypothetical protein BRD57_02390 [Proteobacteria bacterium SW_6_67_9]
MKSTIQRQVLLLALLPTALIALVLTLYHTHTRLDTLERHTLEQARSIASQCAALAASGVATVDREAVRAAAQATLSQEQALVQVTIRDDDRRTLARASRERSDDLSSNALRTLTQPVVVGRRGGALRWSDPRMTVARDQPGQTIGEVEVVVDLTPLHGRERAILWESLGISGLTLLLTGALAFRIGGRVTGPIQRINEIIERIRRGDLGARPARTAEGELGSLERGLSEMADAIEAQQTAMQARVDHKTTELESTLEALEHRNAELEESNLEAQAASAFKSRFLANISHEIRTPMNSIVGFAELLDGANLDAVELDYLENIRESARSLLGLLNGILDLSQIESGRMELEHVETDLNAVLVEVFHLFGPHALRKGVELYVHPVAETLARVYTDPLRLKQVLINFVSNAVKFTEEGSIDIAVEGTVDDDGHAHLRFASLRTGPTAWADEPRGRRCRHGPGATHRQRDRVSDGWLHRIRQRARLWHHLLALGDLRACRVTAARAIP